MPDGTTQAVRDVTICNKEGLHARPVMRFVDLAATFRSSVTATNVSGNQETVDGKSAMQMMLLEATQGSLLRIEAHGEDALAAVEALSALVENGFASESPSKGG